MRTAEDRDRLARDVASFTRMYAPHEAREDTVLFPALHKIVSKHEYDSLGEEFEKIERQTFGGDGFDIYVEKVTALEKNAGDIRSEAVHAEVMEAIRANYPLFRSTPRADGIAEIIWRMGLTVSPSHWLK